MGGVQRLHDLDDRVVALARARAGRASRRSPGASWRIALSSRPTPLPCSAEPISTGQIEPARISLTRSLKTLSRVGLDVLEQLLHQPVVVVGERLEHGEAGLDLAGASSSSMSIDLARGVLAIDEGALEREVDEAGDDAALPDRDVAQHQRHAARRLQHLERRADAGLGLVDLVEEQDARDLLRPRAS